ncbi:unnamed protein product [Mytilus coruscus]|uniref:Uncharacterized protein n=1 Tax=Mytilus coruscus TaxID=42192 RepID=A0A6J8C0K0_MYTCO|nr:unnamed protein product [Mytilus coruscus]
MTLNGEPIKVITHGYKPDFSKFKEVKYQDATKNASLEETKDEYQYENAMLNENLGDEPEEKTNNDTCDMCYEAPNCETGIPMIPELEGYHEISTVKPVTATDDESIHNPLPGSYARCPIENDFYMDINTADTYPLSEFHYDYNCSTPLITTSISSPDHAETEENSSNTASINNNLNYDYHDDNTFDNTIMNIDSTNDGMDYGILISTDTVTRGSSSSMNGQSCPDDEHLNSNQSMNFSEMDFWFADKTN